MKIYHYTSIETLVLILKNRTIRFSKLTKVDDPEEYSLFNCGFNPAEYEFVSCWTRNEFESIPQWLMYGNKKHGVRIALDEDMFEIKSDVVGPRLLSTKELEGRKYELMPIIDNKILFDINYVENIQCYIDSFFRDEGECKTLDFAKVGIYKRRDWEFQKECRFIFHAMPKRIDEKTLKTTLVFGYKYPLDVDFIDIPIKRSAFEKMEVMLGPEVSEAESTIVEVLCQKYLGNNRVRKSIFY